MSYYPVEHKHTIGLPQHYLVADMELTWSSHGAHMELILLSAYWNFDLISLHCH